MRTHTHTLTFPPALPPSLVKQDQPASQDLPTPTAFTKCSEYLYLTHGFVLNKLKAFSPPCQVCVQLEVGGQRDAGVREQGEE